MIYFFVPGDRGFSECCWEMLAQCKKSWDHKGPKVCRKCLQRKSPSAGSFSKKQARVGSK